MGAYSPVPTVDADTEAEVWDLCRRTVDVMAKEGVTYRGLLYAGLMLTGAGPKVLEYNCRFGDPETEVVIPRLASDLADLLEASATGALREVSVSWRPEAAVTVVLASGGYPGSYEVGMEIQGLDEAGSLEGVAVFHAGTAEQDDRVVTAGGRVLAVSALGASVAEARGRAYTACELISFEGKTLRRDVALQASRGNG